MKIPSPDENQKGESTLSTQIDAKAIWDDLGVTQQKSLLKLAALERGWHYASINVRSNGRDHNFDATWLRKILRAFAALTPKPDED